MSGLRFLCATVSAWLVAAAGITDGGPHVERLLVFEQRPAPDMPWIWKARLDGTHRVRLTQGGRPEISPDGRLIAFLRLGQNGHFSELWLIASSGGEPRLLRQVDGRDAFIAWVRWIPDSARLLVVESDGRFLIDLGTLTVTSLPAGTGGASGPATFSPDGSTMAFVRADSNGSDIYGAPVSGGSPRQITFDHMSSEPVWGPAGEIAYFVYRRGPGGEIRLMRPDGSEPRQLTHPGITIVPFAWSADGRRLLAVTPPAHNGRIWAIDVRSGRVRARTRWVGDLVARGFSQDGKLILAGFLCGTLWGPGYLATIPFAGGQPRIVVHGACQASWNA